MCLLCSTSFMCLNAHCTHHQILHSFKNLYKNPEPHSAQYSRYQAQVEQVIRIYVITKVDIRQREVR